MLKGLARRGVAAQFEVAPAAGAPVASNIDNPTPTAKLSLNLVWIMPVGMNYSANAVFGIDASATNGQALHDAFRGRSAHVDYFNGDGEKVGAINSAR